MTPSNSSNSGSVSNNNNPNPDHIRSTTAMMLNRRSRSDSIPENRPIIMDTTTSADPTAATSMELLMRHSSPLVLRNITPPTNRPRSGNNSPISPLRLNRPRSNPRNRTPNRATDDDDDDNDHDQNLNDTVMMGRRITIRPMAGAAVGTHMAGSRIRQTGRAGTNETTIFRPKSRKQGPSHRKIRRWNNANFVNLAAEISTSSSNKAAEALLLGSVNASKYKSILDPDSNQSTKLKEFYTDDTLIGIRQQFWQGEIPKQNHITLPAMSKSTSGVASNNLSPLDRYYHIDGRLRRIITKACINSYAASKVITIFEGYLINIYTNIGQQHVPTSELLELLLEPPIVVTTRDSEMTGEDYVIIDNDKSHSIITVKFLFDGESSPTGGFHRLLLHGLCQYYGLHVTSSSIKSYNGIAKKARALTGSGIIIGANDIGLVDFIAQHSGVDVVDTTVSKIESKVDVLLENETQKLSTLKV